MSTSWDRGGDCLRVLDGWLPEILISHESLHDMALVADQLVVPARTLIECPLGDPVPTADVSLSFERPDLATERSQITPDSLPSGLGWDRLRRFISAWIDPSQPLSRDVRSLWLEFDLRQHALTDPPPLPNVFFGTSHGQLTRATMTAGLEAMLAGYPSDLARQASDYVDTLPPGAEIAFTGLMLGRRPEAVRLCVHVPISLGWPDPQRSAIAHLLRLSTSVVVQLDPGATTSSTIGFELFHGHRERGRANAWRPLLEALVREGVAREDRCAAALGWPGHAFDGRFGPRVIARWINHVKLTCEAGSLVEAKVYLQSGTAWRPSPSDAETVMDW